MNNKNLIFDLKDGQECRWLADLIYELQAHSVKFTLDKDANLVYIRIL